MAEPWQTAVPFTCLPTALNIHESNQEPCLTQAVILITCTIAFIFLFLNKSVNKINQLHSVIKAESLTLKLLGAESY